MKNEVYLKSRMDEFKSLARHNKPFGVNVSALKRARYKVQDYDMKRIVATKGGANIICERGNVATAHHLRKV